MKRAIELTFIILLLFSGMAHATLTTIGTANYEGNTYNLIYMDDGPFGPITWLDYTSSYDTWYDQVAWAYDLGEELTVTLYEGYTTSIDWSTGWRLPTTGGNTEWGYNITVTEMGYLYYESLDNSASGLSNKGPFINLHLGGYFTDTDSSPFPDIFAMAFWFRKGYQETCDKLGSLEALAVRSGEVTYNPVPEPATLFILGTGVVGLAGIRRRSRAQISGA